MSDIIGAVVQDWNPNDLEELRRAILDRMREDVERFEEELLYGYVGGRADDERSREQARHHRSKRIIDRAIEDTQ